MITNVTKQTDHHVGNVSKEQHQRSVEVDINMLITYSRLYLTICMRLSDQTI